MLRKGWTNRRTQGWLLPCLLGAALLACTPRPDSGSLQEKTSGESVVVEVNSKASAFAARTLDGGVVRLADYVGSHVVLLEFWSIFCKSCIEEMPHIEALYEKYGDDGLAVLSVNTDVFSTKKIRSFMARAGIQPPYPVLRDPRQEVAGAFGVEILPVTVIIDRDGWIRLYQEGYRPGDERTFERKVRSLLGRRGGANVTLGTRGGVTAFAPAGSRLALVGDRFAGRRGRTLDGVEVQLGGGQPHLLYFWSLYCSPCRVEFPEMVTLARRYRNDGLRTVTVNVDSPRLKDRVARFIRTQGDVPCVLDGETEAAASLSRALGVRATPTLLLFDGKGEVVHAVEGAVDRGVTEARIKQLLGAPEL